MKNKALILMPLAIAAAIAAGCKQSNGPGPNASSSDSNSFSVTQQMQNIETGASNVWEKTKEGTTNAWNGVKGSLQSAMDYTYDKKGDYMATAQSSLDTMDQKIKDLSDKVAAAADSAKADAQAKLQTVTEKRAELGAKFDKMKDATADSWDNTKTDFKNSYEDVKTMIDQAWQSLTN